MIVENYENATANALLGNLCVRGKFEFVFGPRRKSNQKGLRTTVGLVKLFLHFDQ